MTERRSSISSPVLVLVVAITAGWLAIPGVCAAAATSTVDFVRDVQPILAARCYDCHGAETRESGLRLDRRRGALTGGDSGTAIVPGKAAESLLFRYVSGADPDHVMPPEDPLNADQVATLRRWIDAGAVWPEGVDPVSDAGPTHWAYRPLASPIPPAVAPHWFVRNSIDAFIVARLESAGIDPSPEADRYTLIRRLYYDLLGLPPDPESVDRFVADAAPDAYERLVDELLASPHFGERWGRHWLDAARYADSDGYEKDNPRYNAWKYRDWVIQAVNNDLPFDQFTIEQLAGDLLPEATEPQRLATAFNRQTLTNTEGGADPEQWRVEAVFDRTETLGAAWLGLTVGCARCHSHKYDAISQREYFQLFAFFNNGDEATMAIPSSAAALAEYQQRKAAFDARLAEVEQPLNAARAALKPHLAEWEAGLQQKRAALASDPQRFHPLVDPRCASASGATLTQLEDGSFRASGARPVTDIYTCTATLPEEAITGLRIEALTDAELPGDGPGRADHGNFVLSEVTATVSRPGGGGAPKPEPLTFSAARADFSQKGFAPEQVFDGREDATGWAVAPQTGKDHVLILLFKEPLTGVAGSELSVRLSQQYGKNPHTLGRFRISAVSGNDPASLGVPDAVLALLAIAPNDRSPAQSEELFHHFASLDPQVKTLQADVDTFRKQAPFNPEMSVAVIQERKQDPRATHVMKRGDFLQPLGPVQPGTLETLPPLSPREAGEPADRLDLARWLVSPENPLPPRVVVNRMWQRLFGRGIVRTVNDFGVRGEAPSHPELLDWLAGEFARSGWSRKRMIRTLVTSGTYRQSSAHRPELVETDPENSLLARQNRIRVEAEIVRDLYLAAARLLEPRIGGPSVFPDLPADIAALSYADNFKWGASVWNDRPDLPHGIPPRDDLHRRGMYTFFKRTAAYPTLVTFDCPDGNTTCVERRTSNSPLQALTTLNNASFVEAARSLATRAIRESTSNDAARLTHAFQICVARPPEPEELNALLDLLSTSRVWYGAHRAEAAALSGSPSSETVEGAGEELAAWIATVRVILNLDEFITRE